MSGPVRRLLAVSWDMPPMSGPRAVHVSRTMKHLVPLGWESDVVCFGPRSARYFPDADLARRLAPGEGVRLVRVHSPEEWLAFRALWRVCPPVKGLPDEKSVWIRPAVRAARRLAAVTSFDVIATFAQPWSDHLIGRRLRRALGLPWVAHFSDPWAVSPAPFVTALQRRVWSRMEAAVVREADALVFVNQQTADRTMRQYATGFERKVHIVPHGYDADMLPPRPNRPSGGPLRLVHTGRFYPRWRTPESLLRAAAGVRSRGPVLELIFVGTPDDHAVRLTAELGLSDIVKFVGRLSWAESMQLAMTADVLLVIDAPAEENVFLPSKLIDYLPVRVPILGLTPAAGATADVLRALGYSIVPPDDSSAIARAVDALVDAKRSGQLGVSPNHASVSARYDIRRTTAAFADVLAACVRPH